MIFRLSERLNTKVKAGTLATVPLDENPFADWSAGLFLVGRSQYILLTNTNSLYSTVLACKGITDEKNFVERALSSLREFMDADGQVGVYERLVAPVSGSVRFAKALNRSVTGSKNDMTKHAAFWLAEGDVSPIEIGSRLKGIPMSALKHEGPTHGFGREAEPSATLLSAGRGSASPAPRFRLVIRTARTRRGEVQLDQSSATPHPQRTFSDASGFLAPQ
jgi:hypothetical protein